MTRHTFVRRSVFTVLVALTIATMWPSGLLAQQRAVPRGSTQTGVAVPRPPSGGGGGGYYRPYYRYYYPRYYYPYFYGGFYTPFYWGAYWGPYWGAPYPYYYGPGPYYGGYYYDSGAARLQISPREAQVYVDGYFAGVVDNFDGNLQRLNVEPGEHELQVHLQGYRPFSLKVLFVRGRTLKITHVMEPLAPGEPQSTPPKPDPSTRQQYGNARAEQMPPSRAGRPSDFGSLLLRVRPSDATVIVDGEPWAAPEGEDQFVIELTEGPHRVEIRKDGFQTYSTTVRVRRGETVRLNVSLTTGGLISGS